MAAAFPVMWRVCFDKYIPIYQKMEIIFHTIAAMTALASRKSSGVLRAA
ncbi:hypothetical protein [Nitrospirillum amazonense]|nr:hypothetical protein [Nitrospirillum amazonense]